MTAAAATERSLQEAVEDLAKILGWRSYHTHDSRNSAAGFPDLVLCHPGRNGIPGQVVYAELKSSAGKVTPDQQEWLTALRSAGQLVFVWRPEDWEDIVAVLRGLR